MKIFYNHNGVSTITCPICNRTFNKDLGQYGKVKNVKWIKFSCPCGHVCRALLEKRRHHRKEIRFTGKYSCSIPGKETKSGLVTVLDASQSGIRIQFNSNPDLNIGDEIEVEFWLDEDKQMLARKRGVIQWIDKTNAGIEFNSFEHYDKFGQFLVYG